ncbi:putative alpha/beta hydrolase [Clathrospora elynae]|uniref:Putative alpha/beta hydrolase n=1 Tax=Clathrospora elynae TaxID=706981 RepID=A0A6A5S9X9_9PLEO|nr:putative alpha/beta hydrolase [Clathrospora elynae]
MSSSAPPSNATLVNIGTHSLALYTHGSEPSNSKDPVVLFVSGVTTSSLVWAAVTRLLPSSLRSYTYDRSGFGSSEPSPLAPTAENIALELSLLIEKAPIENPLIIVGHSWAGVLAREFIALTGNGPHIAGLVLVDANHETSLQVLNVLDANLQAIFVGVEPLSAKGIEAEHKLTQEEWDAFVSDEATEKFKLQGEKEQNEYEPSFETLRKKELGKRQPLFGDRPVYVIGGMRSRDWSGMYKAGIEKGNGTEEQRRGAREMISKADEKSEDLMKEHLKLSTKGKLVFAHESGHFVQLTQPDIVVDGVKWILDELKTSA